MCASMECAPELSVQMHRQELDLLKLFIRSFIISRLILIIIYVELLS